MSLDPGQTGDARGEYTLGESNTFSFLPGTMTGVSCPACFKDQLLKEVIRAGECRHCGTALELTLSAGD